MADNVTLDVMTGGDNVAADDIGGVKFQRIKMVFGGDGINSGDVQEENPFPIQGGYKTLTATISNGNSLSDAIDLKGFVLVNIQMPATWTTAVLSFQGSYDGVTYNDIYDNIGVEVTASAGASRCICELFKLAGFRYLKIRSGTTATPVPQGGDRSLQIILKA